MNVLVDTCIWSLALRRHSPGTQVAYLEEFKELISEARVRIIGPVRQEILSGIKSERQFEQLKHHLAAFPDVPITTEDFEQAAHFFNLARSKGIQIVWNRADSHRDSQKDDSFYLLADR